MQIAIYNLSFTSDCCYANTSCFIIAILITLGPLKLHNLGCVKKALKKDSIFVSSILTSIFIIYFLEKKKYPVR